MKPKGQKKLKGKAKEEMLITSRLMSISLRVDDYIYKNKPISLLEAKKFDEEVTSLKLKCKQDTRSLQVVEKLKIFMKSIIKEQSMDRQDELKSFATETSVNNSLIALNVISEDVENNSTNNVTTNASTELFSNRETDINNIMQDINSQMKMSINITSPVSVGNSEIKPVKSKDIITPNNTYLKLNDKNEETIGYTSKNIDFDKVVFITNPTNDKEQAKQDSVMITTSNLQKHSEQQKIYIKENQKLTEITTGTKMEEKQTKTNKKTRTKNKTTAKNNIKTKTRKVINKEIEKRLSNQSRSQSKKKPKENKQMNLSWVENIKHVREVSPDEHTDLQVEDSFWTNLDLPGIWNSNDFD